MNVKAVLVDGISKKGNPYKAVDIFISDTVKKRVFLTPAEVELLKLTTSK